MDIFLYLKFRFYSFVFSKLSLYSFFSHFCFLKENATITNQQNTIVNFVLEFIYNCLIVMLLFKILLLMSEILLLSLINFLKKLRSFFLIFALIMHFFFYRHKKDKIFKCAYFNFIRTQKNLFKAFLTILIRFYVSYFISLLNEVNLNETHQIFLRQQICFFASDFMYDFCHVNIDYFNKFFDNMKFSKNYTSSSYRVLNKHSVVDRILGKHPVTDLT